MNADLFRPGYERLVRLAVRTPDGCLLAPTHAGHRYANLAVKRQGKTCRKGAHVVAHLLFVGPIPEGHNVCHSCDRPNCIEPAHLRADTQSANIREMYERGRASANRCHGEAHRDAIITAADVVAFREYAASGASLRALAMDLGLSYGTVYNAVRGITWAHVTEPPPVPKFRPYRRKKVAA